MLSLNIPVSPISRMLYYLNKLNKFEGYYYHWKKQTKKAWNYEIYLGFLERIEEELKAGIMFCHKKLWALLILKLICMSLGLWVEIIEMHPIPNYFLSFNQQQLTQESNSLLHCADSISPRFRNYLLSKAAGFCLHWWNRRIVKLHKIEMIYYSYKRKIELYWTEFILNWWHPKVKIILNCNCLAIIFFKEIKVLFIIFKCYKLLYFYSSWIF